MSAEPVPPRPLRWLVMGSHVPPSGTLGGIVRYTVELTRALERRDDVEVHVLTSEASAGPLDELLGLQGRIITVPATPDALVPAVERYLIGHRLQGFDVVQGTKHLLPRRVAARTALTVHDMLLFDRPADFPTAKRHLLRRPYAASLRQADTLLCVSAATRRRVVEWNPLLAGRTVAVPLATSPTLLGTPALPVPQLAGRTFGLVVGDSQPRKNVATVVSAWREVVRQRPEAVLALVGPPAWGVEAYGPHHADLLLSGNLVQLTGIGDAQLRWCYENSALVLTPSHAEGFGLPAVEALDLGAPLVTSTDAALVEASGGAALHLPALDVTGWTAAALEHLRNPVPRPRPRTPRSWDDVAAETVAGVLRGRLTVPGVLTPRTPAPYRHRVVELPSDEPAVGVARENVDRTAT